MTHLSDAGLKDPSMLGTSGYGRNPLDFYPTPESAFNSAIEAIGDDLAGYHAWEPFAGNGAISSRLPPYVRSVLTSDIKAYEGLDPMLLIDFFNVHRDDDVDWISGQDDHLTMAGIEQLFGYRPDLIFTNPPYGKEAEKAARHALRLMEPEQGMVVFLCRHEWDTARGRSDLFDHPAYMAKITMRHRPRWIEGSDGAPRHSYAWYVWSWVKALSAPSVKPEIIYVR